MNETLKAIGIGFLIILVYFFMITGVAMMDSNIAHSLLLYALYIGIIPFIILEINYIKKNKKKEIKFNEFLSYNFFTALLCYVIPLFSMWFIFGIIFTSNNFPGMFYGIWEFISYTLGNNIVKLIIAIISILIIIKYLIYHMFWK